MQLKALGLISSPIEAVSQSMSTDKALLQAVPLHSDKGKALISARCRLTYYSHSFRRRGSIRSAHLKFTIWGNQVVMFRDDDAKQQQLGSSYDEGSVHLCTSSRPSTAEPSTNFSPDPQPVLPTARFHLITCIRMVLGAQERVDGFRGISRPVSCNSRRT
jgi:hypothetical protein